MHNFGTIKVGEINAKEIVEQLVIDDVKQLDNFEKQLARTTYLGEYRSILKYIEHLANGNTLPETKFRHLKGVTDGIPEHEFKSKHLRVYAIQLPSKKLVIFLGFKTARSRILQIFERLRQDFYKV